MEEATQSPLAGSLSRLLAERGRLAAARPVRIIVLGDRSRGDDAVAFVAAAEAMAGLPEAVLCRVEVRETGQLDPADLVEIPRCGAAIVVDAVVGVPAGHLIRLPLGSLRADDGRGPVPRSSHVLPLDQLVALAGALRGADPPGVLLGVGAERFGFGHPLSPAVAAAVPALARSIRAEAERLVAELPDRGD